jgi:hypothetical protein
MSQPYKKCLYVLVDLSYEGLYNGDFSSLNFQSKLHTCFTLVDPPCKCTVGNKVYSHILPSPHSLDVLVSGHYGYVYWFDSLLQPKSSPCLRHQCNGILCHVSECFRITSV